MKINKIYWPSALMEIALIEERDEFWACFLKANESSSTTQEFAKKFVLNLGENFLLRSTESFQKCFSTPQPGYERTNDHSPIFSNFEEFITHRASYNTFRNHCANNFSIGIHNIVCLPDIGPSEYQQQILDRQDKRNKRIQDRQDKFHEIIENT